MSTYYEYQDVKVMIANELEKREGWTVYGHKEDRSDSMTDYYDPESWDGLAEKNGYILCVDRDWKEDSQEIRQYNYDGIKLDMSITEKIKKLEEMTVERGASEQEEESAKKTISRLKEKAAEQNEAKSKYIVTGIIPGHMANPPRCNWHIEKDGVYIAKGTGLLKFAKVDSYYRYDHYKMDYEDWKKDKEAYAKKYRENLLLRRYYNEENVGAQVESAMKKMQEDHELLTKFIELINKIDSTCGGMLGEGDGVVYEKVKITEHKKEIKPFEIESGSIKEGQCFIVKVNFNYGIYKGYVYKIHEREHEGNKSYYAYKLNGKNTKECTGMANRYNYWYIGESNNKKFLNWINEGSLAWCELREVKTPYEVEKVIKKNVSNKKSDSENNKKSDSVFSDISKYTYEITEDVDTRDNSKIWLVKIAEKLNRDEYIEANKYMKSIGGYYSKFKHSFLFKKNPAEILNGNVKTEGNENEYEQKIETVNKTELEKEDNKMQYIITEDVHTKTGKQIWVVTFAEQLSKDVFAEEKRKLAVLNGYYSSFVKGFIFNYDPTEKLQVA